MQTYRYEDCVVAQIFPIGVTAPKGIPMGLVESNAGGKNWEKKEGLPRLPGGGKEPAGEKSVHKQKGLGVCGKNYERGKRFWRGPGELHPKESGISKNTLTKSISKNGAYMSYLWGKRFPDCIKIDRGSPIRGFVRASQTSPSHFTNHLRRKKSRSRNKKTPRKSEKPSGRKRQGGWGAVFKKKHRVLGRW